MIEWVFERVCASVSVIERVCVSACACVSVLFLRFLSLVAVEF